MIVDAIPIFKMAREKSHESFKESFETAPVKGYCAVTRN
jgi:hypothetical protein